MNYQGIIIGAAAFIIIGLFHPIVIKAEYFVGKRIWPLFLAAGLVLITISAFISNLLFSSIIGVSGFACLWSIHEIIEQEERVKKGWFPSNPKKSRH